MSYKLTMKQINMRFADKTKTVESGCLEWQGFRSPEGYGKFKVLGESLAHRVSWLLHKGYFDLRFCVLHKCDNPPCVNPDHLFLGTKRDNNKDRAAKGRNNHRNDGKTHCRRGHEFTKINTFITSNGGRKCRECENLRSTNVYRMIRVSTGKEIGPKNKDKTHCKRNHPFNEENTIINSQGSRQCRTCNKIRNQKSRSK